MANCGKDILSVREGTGQLQRFIDALDPDSIKLNDFSLKEWMQFAYQFAEHVNYFNTLDHETPSANWKDFFIKESELEDFLNQVENGYEVTPHLALFVSFIKLLEHSKKRFNKLTKRHLDFYYHNILQIEKLPATPDKVHLIFELAKNSLQEKIANDTELNGGKDSLGKKRIYKTTKELIANKTVVSNLMSLCNDHNNKKLKAASVANSFDGIGADFPNNEIKWWPFGFYGDKNYPELPNAITGFTLSSSIFELYEGKRNILVTVDFNTSLESITTEILQNNIEVYCSGAKKWLGPFQLCPEVLEKNQVIFSSGLDATKKKLQLAFQIPKEEESVVKYDSKVLGENFITDFPVCRILFNTENKEGFDLYRNLVEKEIKNILVDIDVRDIKSLSLESDIGTLNPEKPFYPFGTQPVKHSNFYINYPELFKKEWTGMQVDIEWKNTPEKLGSYAAFVDLYFAYRTDYLYQANSSKFFIAMFEQLETDDIWQINPTPTNLIVKGDDYFKALVEIKNKEDWETANLVESDLVDDGKIILFENNDNEFSTSFSIEANDDSRKDGPVRLSLNQSFLHDLFPRIYALAFSSDDDETLIPNEPYTPMVETIRLNYKAQVKINLEASKTSYKNNPLVLFHEHPFGQSKEHPFLKNQLDFLLAADKKPCLVPKYCKGGELYIGLKDVKNLQQVSLLVQVLEGSENPMADSFTGKQKAEWSVLCQNEWKVLDSDFMISNETDNFLKSGIVSFLIPKEATETNTKLPAGLVWVKVKIHKNYDAVCKVISIQAQAVLAEFSNNDNELSHLENGLEAKTISKLIQRVSTVKSILQPFSSFGGKPEESDRAYYQRISERLRHKNRTITLWDYEHIILQQFPEIHKAKCLNHSCEKSFLSPGNVLIVVIPNIVNKNVFDVYQPRVSQAKLNEIQKHINKFNTLHVNANVINPDYEEVKVDLKVKFYKGFDENYYQKVLNEDITKLLSPWAFDGFSDIDFGVVLYRSFIIKTIEKLEYVDYVEDVKLIKGTEISMSEISPSNPKAILVSAKQHGISTEIRRCNPINETPETCQT